MRDIRYNFDKIPAMASGFGVHTRTIKQAWAKAYRLAQSYGYKGKLQFRDNMKCSSGSHRCDICHP